MLLLHPDIQKTMTEKDLNHEEESGLCPNRIYSATSTMNSRSNINLPNMDMTSFNANNNNMDTPTDYLKFAGTTAFCCLRNIVQDHDFEAACKKIVDEKKNGQVLREQIFSLPRTTAARLTVGQHGFTPLMYQNDQWRCIVNV